VKHGDTSRRVAALYDIHGNLPALEAVLEEVRRADVDLILVGGDVVPGPMPRECLDALLRLETPVQFIRGNGDRVVLAQMRGEEPREVPEPFREDIRWNARQLSAEHQEALAAWPAMVWLSIAGLGDTLFCHASPRNDTDIFTRATPEARLAGFLEGAGAQIIVCGHTHMQFDRRIGDVRIVNAGSVGMPYGNPGAYWLLLGPGIEFRCTEYDLAHAAEGVRQTNYPSADQFAAKSILKPPREEQILKAFG
jgi:predicted phosphodiesterase